MSDTVLVWLSFADGKRAEGQQFLGACWVEVKRFEEPKAICQAAIKKAHVLGINPGGAVQIRSSRPTLVVHETWRDRLLQRAEIDAQTTAEAWASPRPG